VSWSVSYVNDNQISACINTKIMNNLKSERGRDRKKPLKIPLFRLHIQSKNLKLIKEKPILKTYLKGLWL